MTMIWADKMKLTWIDGDDDIIPVDQVTGAATYTNRSNMGRTLKFYQHGLLVKNHIVWGDRKHPGAMVGVEIMPWQSLELFDCDVSVTAVQDKWDAFA